MMEQNFYQNLLVIYLISQSPLERKSISSQFPKNSALWLNTYIFVTPNIQSRRKG